MSRTRIRVTYFDQNELLGDAPPREGVVGVATRRLALRDWGEDWTLLKLETGFDYRGRHHDRLLIRSRWEGHSLNSKSETSVFILLVRDPTALDKQLPESADFERASWGMAIVQVD